jgi:hypothetical protein
VKKTLVNTNITCLHTETYLDAAGNFLCPAHKMSYNGMKTGKLTSIGLKIMTSQQTKVRLDESKFCITSHVVRSHLRVFPYVALEVKTGVSYLHGETSKAGQLRLD